MKYTAILSFSLLLLSVFTVEMSGKDRGFSGKWVLDNSSDPPGNAPNKLEERIKQDGSGVTIDSTFQEPADGVVPLLYLGVMTSRMRLKTDGELQQNQIGPFQIGSKTTINGNQMSTDWTAKVNNDEVQGHWTHTLSSDGKRMTLAIKESSRQGQGGEATLHFVRK